MKHSISLLVLLVISLSLIANENLTEGSRYFDTVCTIRDFNEIANEYNELYSVVANVSLYNSVEEGKLLIISDSLTNLWNYVYRTKKGTSVLCYFSNYDLKFHMGEKAVYYYIIGWVSVIGSIIGSLTAVLIIYNSLREKKYTLI